ncbi:MAG TPA: sulfotransferase [Luteimonas sp.]|nr:sulfotransferase [Luteimonas sp.]
MQQQMDDHWKRGQQFEAARDLAAARAEYETLLALDGRHIPARLRLSRFEQMQGRYRRARQHALQAADAIRGGAGTRLLSHVTLRLLEFAEDIEVATLVLSVDWEDPHVLAQSPMLAQHLWLAGRYEDALRFLDAVSSRLPPQPLLLFTRANVLRYLGHMDEAAALYEQCLALRPGFADAHWAVATHRRAMPPDARLQRLREALDGHPGEDTDQAQLRYAMFRELDAAGDTAGAWDALSRGARTLHAHARHDAASETARLEALMRENGPSLPQGAAGRSSSQPTPVFIVGLPRTGTTLLDRILGNHGWVTSAGERNDFAAAVSEVGDRFFSNLADEPDPATLAGLDHRAVGHLYVQRLARHASATAVAIDKNPRNLFNLPLILRALPQAKVLVLERDPMDSAFSNFKEPFQGGAYGYSHDFDALAAHVAVARRWMRHWARVAPDAVRIVRYESLVGDTEATVAGLLEFLGLPHAPGLADITRNDAPVATASSAQVREPIHGRGIGAWRRYASQLEPLRAALERADA